MELEYSIRRVQKKSKKIGHWRYYRDNNSAVGTTKINKSNVEVGIYRGIKQFSAFLDGGQKTLSGLIQSICASKISVIAFSSVETTDHTVLRFITNYNEECRKLLLGSGIAFAENNVLGVEFFHSDDIFKIVNAISAYEVRIYYMYPIMSRHSNKIGMILRVEEVDLAAKAVNSVGITAISEDELSR
jgi:hypothetical protein